MTNDRLTAATPDVAIVGIHGPADLLQAVPYLLGFHPRDSLVIVGLHGSRLVVTVRMDLADVMVPDVLADAVAAMHRGGASQLVAAVYAGRQPTTGQRPLPWSSTVDALRAEAEQAGCEVLDVLFVAGERWWSYSCSDDGCCPPHGRRLPDEVSEFSAAATYAGIVALPDRDALAAVLAPRPDDERERLMPLIAEHENAAVQAALDGRAERHDRSAKRALFAAARRSDAPTEPVAQVALSDHDVARFGVALSAPPLRDSLWMAADDGRLDGRLLWVDLARRLPSPYDAAPLFLYGWCSWRSGNGALAGIAAERAVQSDPSYSAADLLLAALARGLDPRRLPKLRLPRSA